ncbi:hypothetical protein MASR1M12_23940 [Erysipelotrichia bacterium]
MAGNPGSGALAGLAGAAAVIESQLDDGIAIDRVVKAFTHQRIIERRLRHHAKIIDAPQVRFELGGAASFASCLILRYFESGIDD